MDKLLALALEASRLAGHAIMPHYQQPLSVSLKQDGSPLTLADQASHQVIVRHLAHSAVTIVSEEGEDLHFDAERYWLVDPLDGTKDFMASNGEFTVNIALVDQGRPVLGVVFAPALGDLYWGAQGLGAWRIRNGAESALLPQVQLPACRMAISRFHDHPDVDVFAAQNQIDQRIAVGSALKYGLLAAAEVDVFPRLVGSSEWDTAAGQALLEAAGGEVLDWHTGKALRYGKPRRRNPRLLAMRAPYCREAFTLIEYESELL
ncbi:3'(2'),5'-bisphosphate nucleotidase CysQ [Alphaproteobacteria bacterium LSUCC0684]